jgi:hypothetical protein
MTGTFWVYVVQKNINARKQKRDIPWIKLNIFLPNRLNSWELQLLFTEYTRSNAFSFISNVSVHKLLKRQGIVKLKRFYPVSNVHKLIHYQRVMMNSEK